MSEHPQKSLVITGASGLVGTLLIPWLKGLGWSVCQVGRGGKGPGRVGWEHLEEVLEGAQAVIHLAGENIASGRWTEARRTAILQSRLQSTRRLVEALGRVAVRPKVLVSASAVGFYGPRSTEPVDESADPGHDFLAHVCQAWEGEAARAEALGLRVVYLRLGVVLAREGGALPRMAAPVRAFLGSKLGDGLQGLSWIHGQDLVRLVGEILDQEAYRGPINATSPEPLSQGEFTRHLGRVLKRPILPVPAFLSRSALKLVLGSMAEALLLQGAYVQPQRAMALGFTFRFPSAEAALQDMLG